MKRHIIPITTLLLLAAASRGQTTNSIGSTNAPDTNAPVAAQSTNAPAVAQDTNAAPQSSESTNTAPAEPTDHKVRFKNFQVVVDRNIFNANRSGGRSYRRGAPPARVDSFALLGTMSYEKGRFAFFGGSSSDYHKTLGPSDKIAGYTVTDIGYDRVKLAATNGNPVELCIGMQMKSIDGGPWAMSAKSDTYSASTSSSSTESNTPTVSSSIDDKAEITDSPSDDATTKALKRLMKKRKKELSK